MNLNIFDVRGNPELVNQQLEQCTDNFAVEQSATCFYERMITGRIYWCQLAIDNPSGRDDFEEIGGDHLPGSDDSSISYVLIERQNTRIVPSIVCRQFPGMTLDKNF